MKNIMIGVLALTLLSGCSKTGKNSSESGKIYPPFDIKNMDTSIKPGDDFFLYANGTWVKNNPIPADKNSISSFDELLEKNRHDIREIIEETAATKEIKTGSVAEKIGKFYNSGMDTVSIEQMGTEPIKKFFEKIESIRNPDDVQSVAAYFQTYQINTFFVTFSNQDAKNSSNVIACLYQSGIGLPDRDY